VIARPLTLKTTEISLSHPIPGTAGAVLEGPLDAAPFPETLSARVVTPGPRPRLHGYDVEADLARHYTATDIAFLTLTGELPAPEVSAALGIAFAFLAPVSVAHASVHAAVLARTCGTTSSSTLGVAAIALAEQARVLLDDHAAWLAWLAAPSALFPELYRAADASDAAASARLREALSAVGFRAAWLAEKPTRSAALLGVLYACGLKGRGQLEAAVVTARLPTAFAEAMAVKVADFNQYPTNLPRYAYEELP
jgi:hypothetical protein